MDGTGINSSIKHLGEHVENHLLACASLLSISEHRSQLAVQLSQEADALSRLSAVASRSRTAANSAQPISQLPQELFRLVVSYVAELEPPFPLYGRVFDQYLDWDKPYGDDSNGIRERPPTLGWVRLTHICKSWREGIIDYPVLWARAIGLLPSAIAEFSHRAGSVLPFDLTIRGSPLKESQQTVLMSLSLSRLRSITWTLSKAGRPQLHGMLSGREFPVLETLRIACIPATGSQAPSDPVYAVSLRDLRTTGLFFNIEAPNLIHLSIDSPPRSFTFSSMLEIFSSCPLLEFVDICTIHDLDDDYGEYLEGSVRLDHLRKLSLAIPKRGNTLAEVLQLIRFAPNTIIQIEPEKLYLPSRLTLITSLLSSSWRIGRPVEMRIEDDVVIFGWKGQSDDPSSRGVLSIITGLEIHQMLDRLTTAEIKQHLQDVGVLTITDGAAAGALPYNWRRFFDMVPHTGQLRLVTSTDKPIGLAFSKVLDGLINTEPYGARTWPDAVGLPFPKLRTFTLGPNIDSECLPMSAVVDCLTRRLGYASSPKPKLPWITISSCKYSEDDRAQWMENLKRVADCIQWEKEVFVSGLLEDAGGGLMPDH